MPCGDVFAALRGLPPMRARIMEVCGTHTMSIARRAARLSPLRLPGTRTMSP